MRCLCRASRRRERRIFLFASFSESSRFLDFLVALDRRVTSVVAIFWTFGRSHGVGVGVLCRYFLCVLGCLWPFRRDSGYEVKRKICL